MLENCRKEIVGLLVGTGRENMRIWMKMDSLRHRVVAATILLMKAGLLSIA